MSHSSPRLKFLCQLILDFSPTKDWLMRAPLRVAYEDGYQPDEGTTDRRKSSVALGKDLKELEDRGVVVRHNGCIQIIDREVLTKISKYHNYGSRSRHLARHDGS